MDTTNSLIPLLTIGYGDRTIDDFVSMLMKFEAAFLVDVRSYPYSQYKPEFSRDQLDQTLKASGIKYVFMGDTLGGRPTDLSCYTNGKVDYEKVKEKNFYKQGIARLKTAWEKQLHVVLMCSEGKPQECHRAKLISETLAKADIQVLHIDEKGSIKTHTEIIDLLASRQLFLLEPRKSLSMSRNKYR